MCENGEWHIFPTSHKNIPPYVSLAHPRGGGGAAGLQPLLTKRNLKSTDFVDTTLSKVVRDLRFSQNQPLTSADD
jgi:hypothetical protein